MKAKYIKLALSALLVVIIVSTVAYSCRSTAKSGAASAEVEKISSNIGGSGKTLELSLLKGKAFNHPTFAVWIEDTTGKFLQTLFVTQSFATGTFTYGAKAGGAWKPGQVQRPAALPYWSHRAGAAMGKANYVPDAASPVADAYTAATPKGSFVIDTRADRDNQRFVKVMLEINQTWDWNEYWTNNKFPGDTEYKTSCQPAVVYSAVVDLMNTAAITELRPVGRSHHSGADGNLYTDLNTITTALNIASKITVEVK